MSTEASSEVKQVAKATSVVSGLTLIVYITGFAWRWLSAPYLGTLPVGNAFNWAYNIVQDVFRTWEKLLRPTVIPVFMHERSQRGAPSAWRFISTLVNVQPLILIGLTVLGVLFAPQIVNWTSDFKDPESRRLAQPMLRWLFLAVPFLALSVTGYVVLNARKRFALAVVGDWVLKLAMVAGLIVLYVRWGWAALVLAVVGGSIVKFAMYVWGLARERANYTLSLELLSPAMKRFYLLLGPIAIGAIVSFARDMIEYYWRTGVAEGDAASVVVYGRMAVDVPIQVVMLSLGIVIFPFISEAAANNKHKELFAGFFTIFRAILLVFLPMTVGMILLRQPMIRTLLEWKNFESADPALTSQVVFWYAMGFVPFAIEIILLPYYYARQNVLIPTIAGIVTSALNIVLLYWMLHHTALGVGAFTLAMVLTKVLKVIALVALLKLLFKEKQDWSGQLVRLVGGFLRIALATGVMTVVLLWAGHISSTLIDPATKLGGLVFLVASVGGGVLTYLIMVIVLRVEEARLVWDGLMKKLKARS